MRYKLLFLLFFILLQGSTQAAPPPEVVVIHNPQIARSEKEALLILPGFGDKRGRRKQQQRYFENKGYDLFIPDYKDRKSMSGTVENLRDFIQKHRLQEYRKLHVFSYILGSWVLNSYIVQYGKGNIATIVYDRSPLQERAPRVVADKIPTLSKIAKGKVIIEMSRMDYPPLPVQGIKIGIIVESKATRLIKLFKKKTLSYGPLKWDASSFRQEYHDLMYTRLNHDELYTRFDVTGTDILNFLQYGAFTGEARRIPYEWDAFEPYKE